MSLPNPAGVIGIGSPPSSRKRATNLGFASTALTALLSFSTTSGGAPLGVQMPYQTNLVSGHGLCDCWDGGQRVDAFRRGHAERADVAGLDVLDRARQIVEKHRYLTAEQIRHRGRRAAIRHVRELDVGHGLQQLARHVRGGANPAGSKIDLARIGLRHGDELGKVLRRKRQVHVHDVG